MAISKGFESKEAQEFKRYTGVVPVTIKAINPAKDEHERLFNTVLDKAPEYYGTIEDRDGNTVQNARIQLVFEPHPKENGPKDMPLISMALFLQNKQRTGATSGKIQVIDKYGRTAWATPAEVETHAIPQYSNGPADIDKDYRPAYVGEEELMAFVKAYLCIPDVTVWDNNLRKMVPNTKVKPEDCECRFDNLDKVFKGDFSEIHDALGYQPNNKVKVLLGVRTDANSGRLFQTVYTRKFLRNSSNSLKSLEKEIQENIKNAVENGRAVDTEYDVTDVHEYVVTPTVFEAPAEDISDLPFGDAEPTSTSPWG